MKLKKIIFFLLVTCLFLFLNSTVVFSVKARIAYNPVNVFLAVSMLLVSIIIILAYVIFSIKYIKKSNKEKKEKIKKIILWLIITIVVVIGLLFGAKFVFETGIGLTSSPVHDFVLPKIYRK